MELVFIAFRNIFRNRRRTILNLVAITVGVLVILNMSAWVRGLAQSVYQSQMDLDTAQVQLLHPDYQAEKTRLPLDLGIEHSDQILQALGQLPGLVAVTPRIDTAGEFTNGVTGMYVMARGVDPAGEAKVTAIASQLSAGQWLSGPNDVVIGSGLAAKLELKVGSAFNFKPVDKYGKTNLTGGTVVGIFNSGFKQFDDRVVFLPITTVRSLLFVGDQFSTRLVAKFQNTVNTADETKTVAAALAALPEHLRAHLKTYEWREFAQTIVSSIESRIRILTFMLVILTLMVGIGILNSLSMSVQERYREIGTLRAIGMNRRKIGRMFLWEGAILGLTGAALGSVLGGLTITVFGLVGVDVGAFSNLTKDIPIPLIGILRPVTQPSDFLLVMGGASLISLLGAVLPARRAQKLEVREVLAENG